MLEDSLRKIINKNVLPKLNEFIEKESAFYLYLQYEDVEEGVQSIISPAPPRELIGEVMKKVAQEVYKETDCLPTIIVACEKIQYKDEREGSIGTLDSGIVIVALEAMSARGIVSLYSIDLEEKASKSFDKDSEETPPYAMEAITSFMCETLILAGLREDDGTDIQRTNVEFKFSRN